jgi:hypothetical protein
MRKKMCCLRFECVASDFECAASDWNNNVVAVRMCVYSAFGLSRPRTTVHMTETLISWLTVMSTHADTELIPSGVCSEEITPLTLTERHFSRKLPQTVAKQGHPSQAGRNFRGKLCICIY